MELPPPKVFLSYRRQDAEIPADWLYGILARAFGATHVFKDVDSIRAGEDFAEVIRREVQACDVFLVLMGDRWLTVENHLGGRRLDAVNDLVRLEVEAALRLGVHIIPVLVGTTEPPQPDALPDSMRELAGRQAWRLPGRGFVAAAERLVEELERVPRRSEPQDAPVFHVPEPDPAPRWDPPVSQNASELVRMMHEGPVLGVDAHADRVATASADGTARIWDAYTGRELTRLRLHQPAAVTCVAFSPRGDLVATAAQDVLRVWRVDGEPVDVTRHGPALRDDRPPELAFTADGTAVLVRRPDETTWIWRRGDGVDPVQAGSRVRSAAVDPDGSAMALVLETAASVGTVQMMGLGNAGERCELDVELDIGGVLPTLGWGGGGRLAVADGAGLVVWNPRAARVITRLPVPELAGDIRWVLMDAEGSRVAAVTRERIQAWEVASEHLLCSIRRDKPVSVVAIDPSGHFVAATGDDGSVGVRRVDGGEKVARLAHGRRVRAVRFLSSARVLTGGDDGVARIWRI